MIYRACMAATVLVVDDEKNIRRTLRMVLEGSGFHTIEAASAEECLEQLEGHEVDMVILDVRLPKMSGLEALAKIRSKPETRSLPVLMVSGHASLAEAVQAVQLGATDFFEKPLDRDRVLVSVRNALQTWQLQREVEQLRADVEHRYEMIGESPVIKALFAQIEKVAPTNGRVLIFGESGTGKELIARAIHRLLRTQEVKEAFTQLDLSDLSDEQIRRIIFEEQFAEHADLYEEKLRERERENRFEIAKNLLAQDIDIDVVVRSTGMEKQELEKIRQSLE